MKKKPFNKYKNLIKIYTYGFLCIKGITGIVFAIKDIYAAQKVLGKVDESNDHT